MTSDCGVVFNMRLYPIIAYDISIVAPRAYMKDIIYLKKDVKQGKSTTGAHSEE
jgi:hypothetical protein